MKNKLTAILALLLAAIMLAGCAGSKQEITRSTEADLNRAGAKVKPVLMPECNPEKRSVQYVLKEYQHFPDRYEEVFNLPTYTYEELEVRSVNRIALCFKTDDVTKLIPLYKYEDVIGLRYISEADKDRGLGGNHTYLAFDWAHSYIYRPNFFASVGKLLYYMPDAAVVLRRGSDGGYAMYDLDNGMRLFYMYKITRTVDDEQTSVSTQDCWNAPVLGNPVIMAKRTSIDEFDGVLKKGATLTELTKIDPAFNAHSDYLRKGIFYQFYGDDKKDEYGNVYEQSYRQFIDGNIMMDRPVSSVLILTDGVLRIFWDYVDDDYVVDRYEFRDDFIIESYGIEVSYKIDDRYYVG